MNDAYAGRRVLVTGGLGFIGSNLARALVEAGARVVLVDSLVPEYGGNRANIAGIEDRVTVNVSDVRTRTASGRSSRARTSCSTSRGRRATSTR